VLFHFSLPQEKQSGGRQKKKAKKIPGPINIDPGIALFYPQMTQVCPLSSETSFLVSDRSSDSRIVLPVAPSQPKKLNTVSGLIATVVPGHSGGPVPDYHRVPF